MQHLVVEIGHPAHVHFFKNPIKILKKRGWSVKIVARDKSITSELLLSQGLRYDTFHIGTSILSKAFSILPGSITIYRTAKQFNAAVLAGIAPVYSSISSRLLGRPCVSFSDTDSALEQILIYAPNSKVIHTPNSFRFNLGKKHHRYEGFHELSYLHPKYFTPNKQVLEDAGILDQGPPIVVRMIGWDATHDFGVHSEPWEEQFIKEFGKEYKILISSEVPLPRSLKPYQNPLQPEYYHDLLAFSRLYVGSGGTSASEAAMLGTPVIYTNPLPAGIFDALEFKYKLVRRGNTTSEIMSTAREILTYPRSVYLSRRKKMIQSSVDVAKYVADAIDNEYTRRN